MTNADRAFYGVVIVLLFGAAAVRPVWAIVDPLPASYFHTAPSLGALEPLDPWGVPWIRDLPPFNSGTPILSAGPDRRIGTPDDMVVWYKSNDGSFSFLAIGVEQNRRVWSFRSAPMVPIAIAVTLLLTRTASHVVRRQLPLSRRVLVASALAVAPTVLTMITFLVNGAIEDVIRSNPAGLFAPALGVIGSVYLAFFAMIFSHRELHSHSP